MSGVGWIGGDERGAGVASRRVASARGGAAAIAGDSSARRARATLPKSPRVDRFHHGSDRANPTQPGAVLDPLSGSPATRISSSSSSPPNSSPALLVRGDAAGDRRCKGPSAAERRVYLLGLWRLGAMAAPPARARADYDYLIKLLLIGDSGVGKSCLLLRFSDGSFTTSFITTIGIDFKIRTVELDGKRIKLQIWDTAGQERFRTITTAYYRGAMGILLVYDVTDESSFNNIRNWIRNIEQHASDNVNKILVGNKADMDESKRAVPTSKGQALADEYGIKFFETSAKTNLNVEQVFFSIARDIKQRLSETDSKPEVCFFFTRLTYISFIAP
ncbi:hypothetical protein GUJ93_ZPchr0013g36540 [Zizania palustris]|uniref:Uncharacterized protein n=1 Tax=Zizania palustris TaxID=103762 RepID=A0A8J6BY23_ZIZPA|nr:hypothetical protein GUJ93_ZPchr0013g36540 [Zizania palustris]